MFFFFIIFSLHTFIIIAVFYRKSKCVEQQHSLEGSVEGSLT